MSDFFDKKKERSRFSRVLFPFLVLGFHSGIDLATKGNPHTALTSAVRDYIDRWSFKKASFVTDTTEGMLQDLLTQAVDDGWGAQKLGQAIRTMYDDMTADRSLMIARTETTGAVNYGAETTLREEGHSAKQWSTVMDGRERESHADADGQVVAIDEPFKLAGGEGMFPGDQSLPAEETINCRCTVIAAELDEERQQAKMRMHLRTHSSVERRLVIALSHAFHDQRVRVLSHFPA